MDEHAAQGATTRREHFVPLTKAALTRLLSRRIESPSERERFEDFCRMLEATLHYEYHAHLEQLTQAYHAHDPDCDRLSSTFDEQPQDFFPRLRRLVERANYHKLSFEALQRAVDTATTWNVRLKVDFDRFDELEVFARGDSLEKRTRRSWRTWFRPEEIEVAVYRRLLIAFRLKDDCDLKEREVSDAIYIKLFKDIPHIDLDKLLPGGKLTMTWVDRTRVFAPTVTGLAVTIYKVSKGALLLAFAGIYGILAFLGLVGGTIGYGLRSFYVYTRAKDKYRLSLTENLYYQNLDNNAGVIFRLLYDAEEQEFSEAAMAYFILWHAAGGQPQTLSQLDEQAEALLADHDCAHVDFEATDALDKLLRWGLVQQRDEEQYDVLPIDKALTKLDAAWDGYFHHPEASAIQTEQV